MLCALPLIFSVAGEAMAAGVTAIGHAAVGNAAEARFKEGLQALEEKEYIQAIGKFTNAISLKEDYAAAYYQRAVAKDLLGEAEGFFSADLCFDLIQAMKLGHPKALPMLRENSNRECHTVETMLYKPETVFCADLSSHVLFKMPDYADQLAYVAYLNLFDNRFSSMPDGLISFSYLVHLDMSRNVLADIHPEINRLKWLVELNLNKNKITELPESISELSHLKQLYLRNNKIKALPSSLSQLQELEELDLALNQLESVPEVLKEMNHLKRLILVGNPLSSSAVDELKKKLPRTELVF